MFSHSHAPKGAAEATAKIPTITKNTRISFSYDGQLKTKEKSFCHFQIYQQRRLMRP